MTNVNWKPAEQELIDIVKHHTTSMLAITVLMQGTDTFAKCAVMAEQIKDAAAKIAALDAKHGEH
jgi:hypothetical protein